MYKLSSLVPIKKNLRLLYVVYYFNFSFKSYVSTYIWCTSKFRNVLIVNIILMEVILSEKYVSK